jgi:DNA-binding transcriptional regulator GbsR (MarR family)
MKQNNIELNNKKQDDKRLARLAPKISEIEEDFVYRTGKIGKQWGLGEPAGKIWATLLFAQKPISQRGISEKTGYSLSLISPTLRILVNLNMVRIVNGKNKEKEYELISTMNDAFSGLMRRFLESDVRPLVAKLDEVHSLHAGGNKFENKNIERSLKEYTQLEKSIQLFHKIIVADSEKIKKIEKILD